MYLPPDPNYSNDPRALEAEADYRRERVRRGSVPIFVFVGATLVNLLILLVRWVVRGVAKLFRAVAHKILDSGQSS